MDRMIKISRGGLIDFEFHKVINSIPYLLPIKNNKIINLRTLEVSERLKTHNFTFECPVDFKQSEDLCMIHNFMSDICTNKEDLLEYLQRLLGYCLTGEISEKCFFIWYGPEADNGKSTLINILSTILGLMFNTISEDALKKGNNNNTPNSHTEELRPLIGSRCISLPEAKDSLEFNTSRLKSITGNDDISFRPIGKETIKIKALCKIIIPTNGMPKFDIDNAMMNRLKLMPFNAKFKKNPEIGEYKADDELVYDIMHKYLDLVFTWICIGASQWYKYGLTNPPDSVIEAKSGYIKDINPICDFADEMLEKTDISTRILFKDLYDCYKSYCDKNKTKPLSQKLFSYNMTLKFGANSKNNVGGKIYFYGLQIITEQYDPNILDSFN
jgi:putative DNA primase/helicase